MTAYTITKPAAKQTETAFLQDLTKPSLHALSWALRHPDVWPKGFVWKYSDCSQCAMGMAALLWEGLHISRQDHLDAVSDVARGFAMPYTEACNIFFGYGEWSPSIVTGHLWWKQYKTDLDAITPEMVADQIDAYLERAE